MVEYIRAAEEGWWVRHAHLLKTVFRVLFGAIWLIDGAFKFQPGFIASGAWQPSPVGQPGWLSGWFTFWANTTSANPTLWVDMTGTFEVLVGLALIFGFLRKLAYSGGFLLSLLIWTVPEGLGGPYGPSSTDIGTGAVYAMAFLFLIMINATYGPSRWSLDYQIEKRWPGWARVAEFRRVGPVRPAPASPGAGPEASS
jgi:nitrite reductase (NO-forming)